MINIKYDKPNKLKSVKQSIYVSFEYKQNIVNAIRTITPRFYNAENHTWELSYSELGYLRKELSDEEFSIIGKPVDKVDKSKPKSDKHFDLPKGLKTEMYDYQIEDYNTIMNNDKFLNLSQAGLGKAQPLYSKLLTPTGWKQMGNIKLNDEVYGEDGIPHKVIGVYPQGKKKVYELTFSDGSKCRCSDEHLWTVSTNSRKIWKTITLNKIMEQGLYRLSYYKKDDSYYKRWRYCIPSISQIEFNDTVVPVDPWFMGLLLGDGCFRDNEISISVYEEDIKNRLVKLLEHHDFYFLQTTKFGYFTIKDKHITRNSYVSSSNRNRSVNRLTDIIDNLGLYRHKSETKFIPDVYKYGNVTTRIKLLQGLVDSDGYIPKGAGYVCYSTSSKQLAEDIIFVVRSLGGTCSCNEHETYFTYKGERKQGLNNFELYIKMPRNILPFSSGKHINNFRHGNTDNYRSIRNIEYIGEQECQCICVDSKSHLYITDDFIPTHNTITAVATALKRKELGVKHTLCIVCYCSIVYNMYDQIKTHTGQKAMIVGSRKNKKGQWVVKGNADKLTDLKAVDKDTPYFMITNVQSLQNKDIYSQLKKMVDKGIIDYIIVDELHVCRSSSSIQGKALLNLHPKYFLGLTGTLLTNKATDAYVPLRLTNKIDTPFYRFCNRYCIKGNFNQIVGYRHLDEIQKMIGEVSLRRLKSDVLELPPKIIMKDYVDLGKKQAKLYNDALNGILNDIDKIDSIPTMLACMSRLRQITETAELLSSTITESSKIDRLKEIIGDLDKKEKVVVFTWFSSSADIIKRELEVTEPNSCAVVTGKTKNSAEEIERFKTDPSCRYFIATIKSAGVGLTLTEAHTMVMLSLPWTATDFEQATSRIHRISMDAPANIYVLLARNTIDERVYDIVSRKKALSDCLVDNKLSIKELTKLLAEG